MRQFSHIPLCPRRTIFGATVSFFLKKAMFSWNLTTFYNFFIFFLFLIQIFISLTHHAVLIFVTVIFTHPKYRSWYQKIEKTYHISQAQQQQTYHLHCVLFHQRRRLQENRISLANKTGHNNTDASFICALKAAPKFCKIFFFYLPSV